MNKENLIYTVYKDGKMFHSSYDNIKSLLDSDICYYIINVDTMAYPFFVARDMTTKKDETIGDNLNLVDFILRYEEKYCFVICGISCGMSYILLSLLEQKREELKEITDVGINKAYNINSDKVLKRELLYNVDNLFVGRFARGTDEKEITEQRYVFEKILVNGEVKYKEIFTGELFGMEINNFAIPYVLDIQSFINYFSVVREDKIDLMDLIFLLNKINYPKKDKLSFTRKKI